MLERKGTFGMIYIPTQGRPNGNGYLILLPLPIASLSGQNGLNDMSMNVRQAVATALKLERQQLMVNAQQM